MDYSERRELVYSNHYQLSHREIGGKGHESFLYILIYCVGCDYEITTITKPDTDNTVTTADDYNDILGTWNLTYTIDAGGKVILNFLVEKDDSEYSVTVTAMTVDENGKYVTEQGSAVSPVFDNKTDGRTFEFTTPAFTTLTSYKSKKVVMGEDKKGLYMTVEDMYVAAEDYEPDGITSGDLLPMHNGDKMYTYAADNVRTKVGSVTISYDSTHKEHSYTAMSSALGFKTFNIHASASTSNVTPAHYKTCSCGIKFLEEVCNYDGDVTHVVTDTDKQRVCYLCKYDITDGTYGYCTVSDGSSTDNLMVKIGTVVELPYTSYQFFNGENVKISGWTSFTEAEETGAGKVKITDDGAALVFVLVVEGIQSQLCFSCQ